MTSDLKQLLNESAGHAPAETHSVRDIVRSAQRSHRSHTTRLMGGSLLALVLVAGAGYAALTGNGSDGAQPVHKLEHGVVKTIDKSDLKDARQLVAGTDYDILAEFPGGIDRFAGGWQPDDLIVVRKGKEFVAVSGQDGTETVLSDRRADRYLPMAAGDGHVVWWDMEYYERLTVEDVSSGQEHELSISLAGLEELDGFPVSRLSIEAGRIWGMIVPADGYESGQGVSFSVPLDGSSGLRREIDGTVTDTMVADGKLAWTEGNGKPLMVRDLESGEVSQVADAPGKNCHLSIVGVTAQRILTTPQCSTAETSGTMSSNATVWSLVGGPTIKLDGHNTKRGGLADDRVLFQRFSEGGLGLTTYAYRFDTGEVLDLGTVEVDEFARVLDYPVKTSGNRATIPSPEKKGQLALVVLK